MNSRGNKADLLDRPVEVVLPLKEWYRLVGRVNDIAPVLASELLKSVNDGLVRTVKQLRAPKRSTSKKRVKK